MKKSFNIHIFKIIILLFAFLTTYKAFAFFKKDEMSFDFDGLNKNILMNDNGLVFRIESTAPTVSGLLKEKHIQTNEHDLIIPSADSAIYPGTNIEIRRAISLKVEVDGKKIPIFTLRNTVAEALEENGISIGRLDRTSPDKKALPQNNQTIIITRINEEEITASEDIDFKTTTKNDSKLGWRGKKIETPGEKGTREVRYKVTYKNGKEISRVILSKNIIKEPVTQIETQGTYVKTGKAQKGQGTWYSYQGGLFAASLTIPRGGYARVTNTANGKSVIVQINDSGPYGKGRIIDLDKVAFQKIASLGAGVIGVKVEEVLN
jgi:uncharacterized protein YabE (DUF348 family)